VCLAALELRPRAYIRTKDFLHGLFGTSKGKLSLFATGGAIARLARTRAQRIMLLQIAKTFLRLAESEIEVKLQRRYTDGDVGRFESIAVLSWKSELRPPATVLPLLRCFVLRRECSRARTN